MKDIITTIHKYFLLSRPYTLPNIILIAFLAIILARSSLVFDYVTFVDILFALTTWASMVYLNEAFQKDDGRIKIPFILPAIFFIISSIISILVNYNAIWFLFMALIGTALYRTKSLNWIGSSFVFIFRGFTEVAIFLSILSFHSVSITPEIFTISVILFLITNSRNLIGDVRDANYDKYTLPVKYGEKISRIISIILAVFVIIISPSLLIYFPLAVMAIILALNKDGYFLHQAYVITTGFYLLNYNSHLVSSNLILMNFAYIAMLSSFSYKFVVRKSNLGPQQLPPKKRK